MCVDVTDEASVQAAVGQILLERGSIEILVNCAGFGISGAVEFTELKQAKAQFDVNFFGTVNVSRAVLPSMRRQHRGHIVNISSVAAVAHIPFQAFYSASKAAVSSYSCALDNEVSPYGVRVTAVELGDIHTGFTQARQKTVLGDDEYGGRLPVHVRCLLDEFANIGQIPKFEKLIATIRSREISASIILQSQSQLKAIYKDNADTIVGNCDTTLFLGGKEKTTLKEISEILGKETIDSFNTSETRGRELSHGLNYQKLGKQLMTEDEIAVMDGGKCILQLRGVRPFFSDKFDITKHPKYKYLSDADPKNAFDMEKHLKRRPAIVKPDEVFDYYEIDAADLQEDADHEET